MAARSLGVFVCILMSCLDSSAQDKSNIKTKRVETCEQCWALILKGQLIETLEFSRCIAISGMTCHITLKGKARLPSRIFVQPLDSQNRPLGTRQLLLIYPELKSGGRGWATFPNRIPVATETLVLTGEWNGAYRSAY